MAQQENVFNIGLRGVVYREGTAWLAHCLETDIVTEGNSPQQAMHDLDDLCRFQIEVALDEGDLASVFRPAPPDVWKMFYMAREMKLRRKQLKPIAQFEARQLVLA